VDERKEKKICLVPGGPRNKHSTSTENSKQFEGERRNGRKKGKRTKAEKYSYIWSSDWPTGVSVLEKNGIRRKRADRGRGSSS